MSNSDEDDADKEHAPSQKRLDDARQRGEFARSPDLISAVAMGGFVIAVLTFGASAVQQSGTAAMVFLEGSDALLSKTEDNGKTAVATAVWAIVQPLVAFLLLPGLLALAGLVATRGIAFSWQKIVPKASKISPLANAKQKFGLDGLMEFAKSSLKLALMSLLLFLFFRHHLEDILGSLLLSAANGSQLLLQQLTLFIIFAAAISFVFGGADFGWQIFRHQQRNRMSRKELMDEMKDSEGDPHVKGQRRRKAEEIATNRMLSDVPTADVIIVNPTHYAVALKWKRGAKTAPICVAKGVDEIAAQIRAKAAEAGVPIHRDPPTARAIHATIAVGEPIRSEHFKAVAAAIRFAEAMRAKARKAWELT